MSTMQSPQDEIAAMQATLALHAEDLERIKQWLSETGEAMRPLLENIVAELTATRDSIGQELAAINERLDVHTGLNAHTARLDAQAAAQANTDLEIASIKETLAALVARTNELVTQADAMSSGLAETNRNLAQTNRDLAGTNSRLDETNKDLAQTNRTLLEPTAASMKPTKTSPRTTETSPKPTETLLEPTVAWAILPEADLNAALPAIFAGVSAAPSGCCRRGCCTGIGAKRTTI